MTLKVIGTGSKGNAYLLEGEDTALLIECGVNFSKIKKAANFNLKKIEAAIVTHEHLDHAKSINDVMNAGINVYATEGTHKACNTFKHHRAGILPKNKTIKIGEFKVKAFDVKHDAADPCGFIINHPDFGNLLFITDTFYCPYTFKGINNIILEINFSEEIMKEKLSDKEFLKDRILMSHMSLETAKEFLEASDLTQVNNIVLIHLSDTNSNEILFKKEVEELTQKTVVVADNDMNIELAKTPF